MRKLFLEIVPRVLLGVVFLLGAIDGFLNPQGMPIAVLLIVCGILLARTCAARYASLFEPGVAEPRLEADAPQAPRR